MIKDANRTYVLLHAWLTFSTSFPNAFPSVSEARGFLGKPGSNTGNFYQSFIITLTFQPGGINSIQCNKRKLNSLF